MVAKEQTMSDAKRDHSAFHQSAAVGRGFARAEPAGSKSLPMPSWTELRVVESWDRRPTGSGDPYNGIGARAIAGLSTHK
jgi:hypothetical protein